MSFFQIDIQEIDLFILIYLGNGFKIFYFIIDSKINFFNKSPTSTAYYIGYVRIECVILRFEIPVSRVDKLERTLAERRCADHRGGKRIIDAAAFN